MGRSGTGWVVTRTKPRTRSRDLYRVLILNDDYTPMEFVIHVLRAIFQQVARGCGPRIMLHVHHNGVGECGVFPPYEVAETKVTAGDGFRPQAPASAANAGDGKRTEYAPSLIPEESARAHPIPHDNIRGLPCRAFHAPSNNSLHLGSRPRWRRDATNTPTLEHLLLSL